MKKRLWVWTVLLLLVCTACGTKQVPSVTGETKLKHTQTVDEVDYYTGEHGTYLFRNGTLAGVC